MLPNLFGTQANDYLPEYRFAMPWSSSYLPVDAYRPQDYQGFPAGHFLMI